MHCHTHMIILLLRNGKDSSHHHHHHHHHPHHHTLSSHSPALFGVSCRDNVHLRCISHGQTHRTWGLLTGHRFHAACHLLCQQSFGLERCWEVNYTYGGFHKWSIPIAGWFIMDNPIQMDDLGVPLFQETSIYIYIYIICIIIYNYI